MPRTAVTVTGYTGNFTSIGLDTNFKFGTRSIDFGVGSNWYVTSTPLIPATGNFTVEFWHNGSSPVSGSRYLFRQKTSSGTFEIWTNGSNSGRYQMTVTTSTGQTFSVQSSTAPTTNTWYHLAVSRSGNTVRFFLNGTLQGTAQTISSGTLVQANSWIGGGGDIVGVTYAPARRIDEFRVTNVAKYTANFTAPTEPFLNNDADTLVLFHMETNPPVDDTQNNVFLDATALTSTAQVTALTTTGFLAGYRGGIQTNLFVRLDIPDYEVLTFSDYHKDYTFGGTTYQGIGELLAVTNNNNSLRAAPDEVSITITGIPFTRVPEILNNKIKGSECNIYRGFFDPITGNLLPIPNNPIGKFQGVVSNFDISDELDMGADTGTVTLTLTLTSVVELLEDKLSGRRTNARDFGDEKSMDRVALLSKANFNFGAPV